jgi:hypothetical protein
MNHKSAKIYPAGALSPKISKSPLEGGLSTYHALPNNVISPSPNYSALEIIDEKKYKAAR